MNGRIVSPVVVLLFVSATRTFAGGAGQAAQAPPPAVGMFRGATPIEGRVFDARMAIRTLRYAMLGGRAIIEGDIDLGTPDTRARSSLAMASRFARQVMGGGAIFDRLGPGDRAQLEELAKLQVDRLTFRDADERDNRVNQAIDLFERLVPMNAPADVQGQSAIILNTRADDYRWPGGIIPYEIAQDCPHPQMIEEAIKHWHDRTDRIRLVRIGDPDRPRYSNWVRFIRDQGCYSTVGRLPVPGPQDIGLEDGCGVPQVIHEIGHAVGLFHEQSRNDRDRFIRVVAQNVQMGLLYNFDKIGLRGGDIGPFDFDSIMLYPPQAFSGTGGPTVESVGNPNDTTFGIKTPGVGGRTEGLSKGDIDGIIAMYPNKAADPGATAQAADTAIPEALRVRLRDALRRELVRELARLVLKGEESKSEKVAFVTIPFKVQAEARFPDPERNLDFKVLSLIRRGENMISGRVAASSKIAGRLSAKADVVTVATEFDATAVIEHIDFEVLWDTDRTTGELVYHPRITDLKMEVKDVRTHGDLARTFGTISDLAAKAATTWLDQNRGQFIAETNRSLATAFQEGRLRVSPKIVARELGAEEAAAVLDLPRLPGQAQGRRAPCRPGRGGLRGARRPEGEAQ